MKYPKLKEELTKKGISVSALSTLVNMGIVRLSVKLIGREDLTLKEAVSIKRAIRSDLPLEELFTEEAV